MEFSSKLVEQAVEEISKLPGIGKKTALRLDRSRDFAPVPSVSFQLGVSVILALLLPAFVPP